jgi:hypothetical protein
MLVRLKKLVPQIKYFRKPESDQDLLRINKMLEYIPSIKYFLAYGSVFIYSIILIRKRTKVEPNNNFSIIELVKNF